MPGANVVGLARFAIPAKCECRGSRDDMRAMVRGTALQSGDRALGNRTACCLQRVSNQSTTRNGEYVFASPTDCSCGKATASARTKAPSCEAVCPPTLLPVVSPFKVRPSAASSLAPHFLHAPRAERAAPPCPLRRGPMPCGPRHDIAGDDCGCPRSGQESGAASVVAMSGTVHRRSSLPDPSHSRRLR
jgi:hypothetical protein